MVITRCSGKGWNAKEDASLNVVGIERICLAIERCRIMEMIHPVMNIGHYSKLKTIVELRMLCSKIGHTSH